MTATPENRTLTIKFGRGYDAPWLVVAGTVEEQRQQIVAAAGWSEDDVAHLSLSALATKVTEESTSLHNV